MNKITTTAGLLALGAMGVHAQVYAPAPGTQQATKPWTISAVLRGFYDDNYATAPKAIEDESFGIEVAPSAAVNLIRDQTVLGLNYTYSMRWYEARENNSADHAHIVGAKLSHAFTPRYKLDLSDSFVVAQEPTLLNETTRGVTIPIRSEGDNLRNTAEASLTAGITDNTDLVFGYQNNYVDYEQDDGDLRDEYIDQGFTPGAAANLAGSSRSTVLDRVEHMARINLRQVILPNTTGILGYQFQVTDYNSNGRITHVVNNLAGGAANAANFAYSDADSRNNYSHYFYVGVDQRIIQNLNASIRGGVQYTKYNELDDVPAAVRPDDDTQWSPYVDANLTYTYLQGSYAQLGVRHERIATDVAAANGQLVPDQEATSVYGSLNQRFLGSFVASLLGQYQHSSFDSVGGSFSDDFITAGVNLAYEINRFLSAEVGYNYDRLSSDIGNRTFTRNRVYAGIRATY